MSRTITLKNVSGTDRTYSGQTIPDATTYTLDTDEYLVFRKDKTLMADVINSAILVGDGAQDFSDPVQGWEWVQNTVSEVKITQSNAALGGKVSVHSSGKPEFPGLDTYAVWSGAGDDLGDPTIVGGGELLQFQLERSEPSKYKDVHFNHAAFGRVWIHEAYMKFEGGGVGDYASAYMMSYATQLQQVANLDLELYTSPEDPNCNWIRLAAGGPGTGTHGFAAQPSLVPRTYHKDGDWDYSEDLGLVPNLSGTGGYNICQEEYPVSKYINKIPCYGTTTNYFTMTSDETAEIRPGYFIRVKCANPSASNWSLSVIMELYREQTVF